MGNIHKKPYKYAANILRKGIQDFISNVCLVILHSNCDNFTISGGGGGALFR